MASFTSAPVSSSGAQGTGASEGSDESAGSNDDALPLQDSEASSVYGTVDAALFDRILNDDKEKLMAVIAQPTSTLPNNTALPLKSNQGAKHQSLE